MPEPTRYYPVCDMEADSLGGYIRYTDYAALRKLAEAVVVNYRYNPYDCNRESFTKSVETLAEYLQ